MIAIGAIALSGCSAQQAGTSSASGGAAQQPAAHPAPSTVPADMGSGKRDGDFPRTVTHFKGKTTLDKAPEKVVVINTGQADALLTLGVVPVGSTSAEGADMVPRYLADAYPQFAEQLAHVADVGARSAPDVEAIANIRPDLILMNVAGKDPDALYAALTAVAPTIATEGTGLNWQQDFLLLADGLGRTEAAQKILDGFHARAAELGDGLAAPPTVSFLRLTGDELRLYGVASFIGGIAEEAGLLRPASQRFEETSQDISNEQLDLADADWIFYGVQGGQAEAGPLTDAPLWTTLSAVAGKTAIPVDVDTFFLNAGPTAAGKVLDVLADHLHG
ncbi:ABC transporter substrate-binding protein [Nonomuraea terrae]|uniref:ABC transporter substrate-binding protein n=1 Tax=Nonomuraea terrae TaxID=2530383 RepID=UPI0037B1EC86